MPFFIWLLKGANGGTCLGIFPLGKRFIPNERNWRLDGTWLAIHDRLHSWTRVVAGHQISPSKAILDSQSVATDTMVHSDVGFDAAKKVKGRKRQMTVDTLGLVLRVLVTAADVPEREGGQQVLEKVKLMGPKVSRLYLVWVDGGYSGNPFLQWAMDTLRARYSGCVATGTNFHVLFC